MDVKIEVSTENIWGQQFKRYHLVKVNDGEILRTSIFPIILIREADDKGYTVINREEYVKGEA